MITFDELRERALTPAEKKKREDVAQAIERDNPKMPMAKKMAIATATAKKSTNESTDLEEATAFSVSIEGLPRMFMYGSGPGQILAKLRKIVKQPSMIQDVERVTKMDVKKSFRLKAQGRGEDEMEESTVSESMLGHNGAAKLNGGKSLDSNFNSPESHIDYHHRQSGGHNKSGGDQDRHRYNIAKKLGYKVEDIRNLPRDQQRALQHADKTAKPKSKVSLAPTPGIKKESVDEKSGLSGKTLRSYMSKASDASKHRGLPTKKVDNRYSGVAKVSKELDRRNREEATRVPGMTQKQSDDRLALIKRVAKKRQADANKAAASKARQDAMRGIKKDKYLTRDMPKEVDESKGDHSDIINRAQAKLAAAEKRNNTAAAQRHRETISRHQMMMAKETWEK